MRRRKLIPYDTKQLRRFYYMIIRIYYTRWRDIYSLEIGIVAPYSRRIQEFFYRIQSLEFRYTRKVFFQLKNIAIDIRSINFILCYYTKFGIDLIKERCQALSCKRNCVSQTLNSLIPQTYNFLLKCPGIR